MSQKLNIYLLNNAPCACFLTDSTLAANGRFLFPQHQPSQGRPHTQCPGSSRTTHNTCTRSGTQPGKLLDTLLTVTDKNIPLSDAETGSGPDRDKAVTVVPSFHTRLRTNGKYSIPAIGVLYPPLTKRMKGRTDDGRQ